MLIYIDFSLNFSNRYGSWLKHRWIKKNWVTCNFYIYECLDKYTEPRGTVKSESIIFQSTFNLYRRLLKMIQSIFYTLMINQHKMRIWSVTPYKLPSGHKNIGRLWDVFKTSRGLQCRGFCCYLDISCLKETPMETRTLDVIGTSQRRSLDF